MQSDSERIDHIEENLNVLVGVIAQTQQQMQTLVAGMTAMRAQIKAQQQEIAELKQALGHAPSNQR
jgi:ABC-type transporter Mla subunit MlaD